MKKTTSYAMRLITVCFAISLLGAATAEAVPAGVAVSPRVESAMAGATVTDAGVEAGIPTEGGSVFYNRRFIASTLGRNRQYLLTFDDGPNPNTTPHILDTLRKYDTKAVFFVVGTNVRKYPDIVRRIHAEGHVIGNHTAHHANLTHASDAKALEEIRELNALIQKITGVRPRVFRPPYGGVNKNVLQAVRQEGMDVMLWSVDPYDWRNRSMQRTCENVRRQLHLGNDSRGGIVLMHDTLPSSVAALEPLLIAFAENDLIPAAYGGAASGRSYWHAKAPVNLPWIPDLPALDLGKLQRPVLAALFRPEQDEFSWTAVSLLRARRTGKLFETMFCRAFP